MKKEREKEKKTKARSKLCLSQTEFDPGNAQEVLGIGGVKYRCDNFLY